MRKLLSLALILMMLCPAFALAEEEVEMTLYVGDTFSLSYPTNWTLIDAKIADRLMSVGAQAINDPAMTAMAEQAKKAGMTFFMSEDGTVINVLFMQDPSLAFFTPELLLTLYAPMMKMQLAAQYENAAVGEAALVTLGDNEFLVIEMFYSSNGIKMAINCYFLLANGGMYTLGLAFPTQDADIIATRSVEAMAILSTFTPTAAE